MTKKFLLSLSFFLSIFVFFVGAQMSLAFEIPNRPESFVNDYTNTLSLENKNSLENKISNFEKQTTNEIAIVLIPSLDGDTVENVAQNIFTKWGIGKKDKNNGVLLLVAMAERKTRIQTGYGVEGDLTDLATSYIQSEIMTPAFRDGNYYLGINGALDKIIESFGGNNIVPDGYNPQKMPVIDWLKIGLFVIFFLFIVSNKKLRSKWWLIFLNGRGPWGGGGKSGGGFGGFGGGFSGGGGSSGSW
jgi:uncharacterized protein